MSFVFYNYYLKDDKKTSQKKKEIKNEILTENQNNLIKNLEYKVKFDDNTEYVITAELSELTDKNGVEVVKMQNVRAEFIDKGNLPLIIKSNYANYNNSNYNTEFSENVFIQYDNNTINSENLDLNFTKNVVTIYNNVVYEGLSGSAKTDNIKLDLVTKKINIFMNDNNNKIELISK
tara:strand:- start:38881 stop:39411 length:531 start_codon:yes stop_codon:yes gene_type:complete